MNPMAICPICNNGFDERGYQLVVSGLGVFDSVACVEEARRRHRHGAREELIDGLLEGLDRNRNGSAANESLGAAPPPAPLD